ncbi:MAG: SLOG family protein [Oscillospiraceae bacterium]
MEASNSHATFGHNPMRFAWGFDEEADECREMKLELAQQIMELRQQGVTHFFVACDCGVGLYAAELINVLRDNDPELMLFCITPYEEQATKWTPELRERYFDMLVKCTHMTAVYTHKQPGAQLKAYRTIIRQSDMVLAVYDPASARGADTDAAIQYARELKRPILSIHPDTLRTSCLTEFEFM